MKKTYTSRKLTFYFLFSAISLIYIIRLLFLQVLGNEYKLSAQSNVLRYLT